MGAKRTGRSVACLVGVLIGAAGCSALPAPAGASLPSPVTSAEAPGSSALSSAVSERWATGVGLDGVQVSAGVEPDWIDLASQGGGFAYINVSEGNRRLNVTFADQATAARAVGLFVGGLHVARPEQSSGTAQGRLFASAGGGWKPDGRTLPGIVELGKAEPDVCSGLDAAAMSTWIGEFSAEYRRLSGRVPVIAASAQWWGTCVGLDERLSDLDLALRDDVVSISDADSAGATPSTDGAVAEGASVAETSPAEVEAADVPEVPVGWDRPTLWLREESDVCLVTFFGTPDELDRWAASAQR